MASGRRHATALRGGAFDAVVCQFGVMFFPERSRAYSEARRVLRAGGVFIFNVWDRIEENEFAHTVTQALESLFPEDPPRFMARTPHGYYDLGTIERDLTNGGFPASPHISTVAARSQAASPQIPAIAYCQGTPLRNEIEARDKSRLGEATDIAAEAIAQRFGRGPSTARFRRTLSRSNAERRQLNVLGGAGAWQRLRCGTR